MVACVDEKHTGPTTFSPFNWGRWLKPSGAEVVSSLLNTAEVLLLLWPGAGTFLPHWSWCCSPEPDILLDWWPDSVIFLAIFFNFNLDCLGRGVGFIAEAFEIVLHTVLCAAEVMLPIQLVLVENSLNSREYLLKHWLTLFHTALCDQL